jgi:hypothetical protein
MVARLRFRGFNFGKGCKKIIGLAGFYHLFDRCYFDHMGLAAFLSKFKKTKLNLFPFLNSASHSCI